MGRRETTGPRTTDPRRSDVPVRRLGRRHSPYQAVIGGSLDIQGGDAHWDGEQRSTFNVQPRRSTDDGGRTTEDGRTGVPVGRLGRRHSPHLLLSGAGVRPGNLTWIHWAVRR